MQKTVIILVQARDLDLLPGQPLVITIDGNLQDVAGAGASKTQRADESAIHNETAPAFWTWFVENPRPIVQVSFARDTPRVPCWQSSPAVDSPPSDSGETESGDAGSRSVSSPSISLATR